MYKIDLFIVKTTDFWATYGKLTSKMAAELSFQLYIEFTGNMACDIVKSNAGSLNDDVRRDIVINSIPTWYKLRFVIGQFEVEV